MMKEDNLLLGQIRDKILQCRNQYRATATGFLDEHQQSLGRSFCRREPLDDMTVLFYGGYNDAERVVMLCLPDYETIEGASPLAVIRADVLPGGRKLTHRDYLGSLTGCGIKREMIGDILVRDDGADIIVLSEITDYLLYNYSKAGRTLLSLSRVPMDELIIPVSAQRMKRDTIASMRLDNIVSSGFNLSRGKASEAIGQGLVFVNHIEANKVDQLIHEGDCISFRHKGKVVVEEVGGTSRKGRTCIAFRIY